MSRYRIAIVDDEVGNLEPLERVIRSDGGEVSCFRDPHEAMRALRTTQPDVLLTDLRLDRMSGLDLLQAAKLLDPTLEVIMMTAYGTVEIAVEAMKKGASDFITKPLQRISVLKSIQMARERKGLANENALLRQELASNVTGTLLIGKSPLWLQVLQTAKQAATSRANVLIEGESGTGKGLLAEFIHRHSTWSNGVLVKINCTSIPDNLLEAELFGFEVGAFTGAVRQKKGRVELAQGGTLFLDEIGISAQSLQAKLLRFVQDGEFERLGSNLCRRVETRVISATNVDLKKAIADRSFREDLYYRLNVINIRLPRLCEQTEDIPLLTQHFLIESAKKNGRTVPKLHPDALSCLQRYSWPGNVRELQNVIERAVVLSGAEIIDVETLPGEISNSKNTRTLTIPIGITLRQAERLLLDETLKTTRGDKRIAAHILGIHPRTIYRHLGGATQEGPQSEISQPRTE
jgi:two-component system response regulator HydG